MHVDEKNDVLKINIGRQEVVERFIYLGGVIDRDGNAENDVKNRIGKASAVSTNAKYLVQFC